MMNTQYLSFSSRWLPFVFIEAWNKINVPSLEIWNMVSKYGDFFLKINSFVQLFQLVSLYFITLQQLVVKDFMIFFTSTGFIITIVKVCDDLLRVLTGSLQNFAFSEILLYPCSLVELNEFYCKYITQNIMVCKSFLRWLLPSWCMNQQTEQSLSVQTCIYISFWIS